MLHGRGLAPVGRRPALPAALPGERVARHAARAAADARDARELLLARDALLDEHRGELADVASRAGGDHLVDRRLDRRAPLGARVVEALDEPPLRRRELDSHARSALLRAVARVRAGAL